MSIASEYYIDDIDPDINIFNSDPNVCKHYTIDYITIILQNFPPASSSLKKKLINYNNQSFQSNGHKLDIILDTRLIPKEGHADPPLSEMTPSKSDWEWCAMF